MAAGKSCVKSRKGRRLGVAGKSRVEGRKRGDGVEARIGHWWLPLLYLSSLFPSAKVQ